MLAYMRALGFEEADAERQTASKIEQGQQRYAMEKPRVQSQGIENRENIQGSFENRGLLRSGAYATANARALGDEQYQLGSMQTGLADDTSSLEGQLAAAIAAARRQASERLLQIGGQQYLDEQSLPYRSA
jgi:hypothetical protein